MNNCSDPARRRYVGRRMREWPASTLVLLMLSACTDRDVIDGQDPDEQEPGVQPIEPGAMYSPCSAASECPSGLCVFPKDEAGYCSAPCAAPTDPSTCAAAPGDQPTSCLDINLPGGQWVCALDCDDAPCPTGMRCEGVAASDGERSICF